jgi:hypothetical protein
MRDYQSLEQLENDIWPDIDFPTPLVERCYKFRKIPLKDLTVEQLRVLIVQNIGVKFLLPNAYDILKSNILAEGDCYEGDLLNAVMNVKDWEDCILKLNFQVLVSQKVESIQRVNEENYHRGLLIQIKVFLAS